MNRRSFLKCAACAAGASVLISTDAPAVVVPDMSLKIRRLPPIPNSFTGSRVEFSKGRHRVVMGCIGEGDLRDCHGLCATDEMVDLTVQELEFGIEGLKKLWQTPDDVPLFTDEYYARQKRLMGELRRFHVSDEEKCRIYREWREQRGPHDCVHHHNKTIPRWWRQSIS